MDDEDLIIGDDKLCSYIDDIFLVIVTLLNKTRSTGQPTVPALHPQARGGKIYLLVKRRSRAKVQLHLGAV